MNGLWIGRCQVVLGALGHLGDQVGVAVQIEVPGVLPTQCFDQLMELVLGSMRIATQTCHYMLQRQILFLFRGSSSTLGEFASFS